MHITEAVMEQHQATIMGMLEVNLLGRAAPESWERLKAQELEQFRRRWEGYQRKEALGTSPLACYAEYYRQFGKTYPVLLQMESVLLKGRGIRASSLGVATMFLAEVCHGLLVAGHDRARLGGQYTLDVAAGGESFTNVAGQVRILKRGDLLLRDGDAILSSVLEGQDRASSLGCQSQQVFYCVYGVAGVTKEQLQAFFDDLRRYLLAAYPDADIGAPAYYGGNPA